MQLPLECPNSDYGPAILGQNFCPKQLAGEFLLKAFLKTSLTKRNLVSISVMYKAKQHIKFVLALNELASFAVFLVSPLIPCMWYTA